jgi:hypothetical protein
MAENGLLKHPSEAFIKYLFIRDAGVSDANVEKALLDYGCLTPDQRYYGFLRQRLGQAMPPAFNPLDRSNRESVRYLRDQGVYEFFYPTPASQEAWQILTDPEKRLVVEQALMSRLDKKGVAKKINIKNNWLLTEDGLAAYQDMFWNVKGLTFDEWGRFLYGRTARYEQHMTLLTASPQLALYHLRIEQALDSKKMIQRAMEINFYTLEEVAQKPGTGPDKVKAVTMLTKGLVECRRELSTSDMALKDVLQQFERFRMNHPESIPPDIRKLASGGDFTNNGVKELPAKTEEKEGVH